MNRHAAFQFVSMARKSPQVYGDFAETQKEIVQNYDRIVTDFFEGQLYVFE